MPYETDDDPTSSRNECATDHNNCKPVRLRDLVSGRITKDSIVWVKTSYDACMISSRNHISLIVEDKNNYNMPLTLYSSVDQRATLEYVQKLFPKGVLIGIK